MIRFQDGSAVPMDSAPALVANFMVFSVLQDFPLTTEGSAWYAGISLAGILLIAAMALYGFYTSLGGRPVFGGAVLEE